jgi:hypothetical protein
VGGGAYINARRTSEMGMTSSFSFSESLRGSAKRVKASRISDSSCAVRLFSLASLEGRATAGLEVEAADALGAGGRRRGGCDG